MPNHMRCVWVVECKDEELGWIAYEFFANRNQAREFKKQNEDGINKWRIVRYRPER